MFDELDEIFGMSESEKEQMNDILKEEPKGEEQRIFIVRCKPLWENEKEMK